MRNNGFIYLWADGPGPDTVTLRSADYGKQTFTFGSIKEASICPVTGQELQPDWMAWFPPADAPNANLPIGHFALHRLLKDAGDTN